jgi:hypothetical protein
MARGGRPKLPADQRRTERVVALLTPPEYAEFKSRADAFRVSTAELARRAITRVKMAAPVSAENVKMWREVGRIGANLNQTARAFNGVARRLALLDEHEREGVLDVDPVTARELVEMAQENARQVDALTGVMTEIRALLMDQWRGNLEEVLSGKVER